MKSKKLKPKKTRKGYVKKNKTRGVRGGSSASEEYERNGYNSNQDSLNGYGFNQGYRGNQGYQGYQEEPWREAFDEPLRQTTNLHNLQQPWLAGNNNNDNRRNGNNRNGNNNGNNRNGNNNGNRNDNRTGYNYEWDEDTDEDSDDEVQDYENYQDYLEDLTEGLGATEGSVARTGCTTTTLQEKINAVNLEIQEVANTYDKLVQGIALQTLGEYLESESLESSHSAELSEWHRTASRRANEFQRISEADLNQAFLYLLPSFDAEKKYMILDEGEEDKDTSMHVMIRYYAYKMITALFTRANITRAVIEYDYRESEHRFLENLLGVMRSASQITNQYLTEEWNGFVTTPMNQTMYVHSGGNLTVMLAGMLCYLHDTWNSPQFRYGKYHNSLLDHIRYDFEKELNEVYGGIDEFYNNLTARMEEDEWFKQSIQKNTEKISDIDLIFMGPDYFVDNISTNRYMFQINELTAYVLRRIMVSAHRGDGSPESAMAYHVMPFAGDFDDNWKKFKYSNMSGITPATTARMRALHEKDYYGYRQSSNRIDDVPMYLNRIKQGYQPFFGLDLSKIPEDLRDDYANKYGECLDCSIGAKTNHLYNHKQLNYMKGDYYTIDTLTYELNYILQGPIDDKTEKRTDRYHFLMSINNDYVNRLFQIMGRHIS
jgi:hypothetical protein